MTETGSTSELAKVIDRLQRERQDHQDRIAAIDAVFAQYGIEAGGGRRGRRGRRLGRPKGSGRKAGAAKTTKGRRGRRRRRSFPVTGEQMVINFIKAHNRPRTSEINAEWKKQGRGGSADNTLTKLFQAKQIKRFELKGERGSRYAAA